MLAALVAAASAISESEEALGSRHHLAAYSCNHRTYNHWPRSRQSAELLGLPSILRASYPEGAIGEQHETVDVGAGALEETGASIVREVAEQNRVWFQRGQNLKDLKRRVRSRPPSEKN